MTYGELDAFSGKVFRYLKARGIGAEDFVQILLPRGIRLIAACIGVWRAGASGILTETGHTKERSDFIFGDAGCVLRLDEAALSEALSGEMLSGYDFPGEHAASYAIYTSGSTGKPKGVIQEFGALDTLIDNFAYEEERYISADDRFAYPSPMNFVAAFIFVPVLYAGAEFHVLSLETVKKPKALFDYFEAHGVTASFFTPSLFRLMKEFPDSLRFLFLAGEPCSEIYCASPRLYNVFGQSETGGMVSAFRIDRAYSVTPVGKPCTDVFSPVILGETGEKLSDGETGELCLRNPYFRGYLHLEEATEKAFAGGIYHTGDLAKAENGALVLCGRKDDMIKINGNRVEPGEIEGALEKVTGLSRVMAKGFVTGSRAFVAAYYLKKEAEEKGLLREGKLHVPEERLREVLPQYMLPSYFIGLLEFPKNENGKLSRRLLPEPSREAEGEPYEEPSGETECLIANAVQSVLGLEKVGANDDFFRIGGDSVSAIRLASECDIPGLDTSVIYRGRTVRGIREALSSRKDEAEIRREEYALRGRIFPITPPMKRHLEMLLRDPDGIETNMPSLYLLKDDADLLRLKAALDKILYHHPVFLTKLVRTEDGNIRQVYDPSLFEETKIIRVRNEEFPEIRDAWIRPFEPFGTRLIRAAIYETESGKYLFLDINHMIFDGYAVGLLSDEIYDCYADPDYVLPDDVYYYNQEELRRAPETAEYAEAAAYYREEYEEKLDIFHRDLTLRQDFAGTALSGDFILRPLPFRSDPSRGNVFYMTALAVAIARYNESDCAFLRFTYNGRNTTRRMTSMGIFLSGCTLFLRIGPDDTPKKLLQKVSSQVEFAMAHPDFPSVETYAPDPERVPRFIFQHNITSAGRIGALIERNIRSAEIDKAATDSIFGVSVIDDPMFPEVMLLQRFSESHYKRCSMEKLRGLFIEAARELME